MFAFAFVFLLALNVNLMFAQPALAAILLAWMAAVSVTFVHYRGKWTRQSRTEISRGSS